MPSETPDVPSVLERLEKLEQQSSTMKRVGIATLAALAALVLFAALLLKRPAAPNSRIVEAEGFVLKDTSGAVRAELSTESSAPSLRLMNKSGARGAMLYLNEQGPGLVLYDATKKIRAALVSKTDRRYSA